MPAAAAPASACLGTLLGSACASGPAAPVVLLAALAFGAVIWFTATAKTWRVLWKANHRC